MTDTLTPERRSQIMGRIRSKDTRPERFVRRLVRTWGFRYRLNVRKLPGCPDLVFFKRKKIIFVHGCFWHLHDDCPNRRLPKSRLDFWRNKLEGNKRRDGVNQARLAELGWKVLIIWECELRDRPALLNRIRAFLEEENLEGEL